jgi:hypothetical protein
MTRENAPFGYTKAGKPRKRPIPWEALNVEVIEVLISQEEAEGKIRTVAEALYDYACQKSRQINETYSPPPEIPRSAATPRAAPPATPP